MDTNIKEQIDNMDYESMLRLWRFSPAGHSLFQGESGEYFSKNMKEKRDKLPNEEHPIISKRIGWEK